MADNQNVVETVEANQPEVAQEPQKSSKGSNIKEWFRKLTVKLKRKTQIIPLIVILVTSMIYLCSIGTYSQVVQSNDGIKNLGISMFVNTLLSILVLVVFLNAFPKRKKPNIVYIVAVFVVLAVIIGMDLLFYMNTMNHMKDYHITDAILKAVYPEVLKAYKLLIVHMIFVGISIVVFALLPLYKKAINKINTRKNLEENVLSESIDTSAEV